MSFKERVVNGSIQFLDEQRSKLKQTEVWQALMGAGAVSGQQQQPSSTSSTQGPMAPRTNTSSDRSSSSSSGGVSCESCGISFTIFKRRKVCMDCSRNLCSTCLPKEPDKPSSHRRCDQCHLLATGIFTRQDLEKFKVKHMKNYLRKRNIPTENCKERNDLIEILMLFSRHSEHFRELEEHQRHFQQLQERMRENSILGFNTFDSGADGSASSSSQTPSSSAQATPSLPRHAPGGSSTTPDEQHPQEASADEQRHQSQEDQVREGGTPRRPPPPAADPPPRNSSTHGTPTLPRHAPDGSTTETDEERLQRLERRRQQEMRETEERLHHRLHADEPPDPRPRKQRMSIGQLAREESIDDLSIKQLKEILVTNFVDYKGCVEKHELIERVKRLWQQKEKENTGIPNSEMDECRICMDAVIDCVLLECGHMVTCTRCGKRLAECPICRQYVSRVVHTFKA